MADNTNRLELIISVKDDGSIVIDTVKKKIDDVGQTTEQASAKGASGLKAMKAGWLELAAGVTAGYFIIKKGIDVITNLVNVAAEAEQIEKRAAFQIETWGYKFQEIKPYVDAFADSILKTTRFSDEMARQGLGQIMQFTSSVEEGMKGTRIAMDMSTQTGQDLNSTIRLVGMAMTGNVEILGRWIPELRDLESKLGANASEAEKAAYAIDILNKKFSGAAQADLRSYSGQVTNLKNQWDELKETMGRVLMPYAEQWVAGTQSLLNDLVPTIEKLKNELEALKITAVQGFEGVPLELLPTNALEDYNQKVKDLTDRIKGMESASKAAGIAAKKAAEQAARIPAISVTPPEKDWIKKWVEDFDGVTYALDKLGIKSTAVLSKEASDALRYAEVVKKAFEDKKVSVRDYINALNAASAAMKKLTGEDLATQREEAWDKNAETIKGISKDEEGWLKKVNKANDELFKTLKEIEKLEIPTHADVGPMEREVNAMKEKLRAEGLVIPVTTEGAIGGGGGGGTSTWLGKPIGMSTGLSPTVSFDWPGLDEGTKAWNDFASQFPGGGKEFTIELSGKGSSKKPISEKIREIIGEFGGLDKAMSGMEAEINVAELSLEYNKLQNKLNQIEQAYAQTANMMFMHGYSYQRSSADIERQTQVTEELTAQLRILQMKMDYERMKSFVGSYQSGTMYVPETGLAFVHEGEKILRSNVSMGGISITINGSRDPKTTADELIKIFKYRLSGELRGLI